MRVCLLLLGGVSLNSSSSLSQLRSRVTRKSEARLELQSGSKLREEGGVIFGHRPFKGSLGAEGH